MDEVPATNTIEPLNEVEQKLDLSSNTSVQILRDVLQSTTKELQKKDKDLAIASKKMAKIDSVLRSREDTLALEIRQILGE